MSKQELTQKDVDEMFIGVQAEWDEKLKDSGQNKVSMFIAMDNTGWASGFLARYQQMKEYLPTIGLTPPVLKGAEDITIKISD